MRHGAAGVVGACGVDPPVKPPTVGVARSRATTRLVLEMAIVTTGECVAVDAPRPLQRFQQWALGGETASKHMHSERLSTRSRQTLQLPKQVSMTRASSVGYSMHIFSALNEARILATQDEWPRVARARGRQTVVL